jgi:nitroreductase
MSTAIEAMKTRRSARKYKDDPIPKEVLDTILEAGTYAATGMESSRPLFWP